MDENPPLPARLGDAAYAPGMHLLIDLWGAKGLTDAERVERALRAAAAACGATALDVRLHHFGTGGGVTGVALLAESHISVHTWPESGFAALDVFVCGGCDAHKAAAMLVEILAPERTEIRGYKRG